MTRTGALYRQDRKSRRGTRNYRALIAVLAVFAALASAVGTFAFMKEETGTVMNVFSAAEKYVLEYNANVPHGETVSVPAKQESWYFRDFTVSTATPVRPGYTFLGWKLNSAGTGAFISGSYTVTNKTTVLYAQWEEHTHTFSLVFHANGGDNVIFGGENKGEQHTASVSESVFTANHTFAANTLAASAEREDYTFLGWAEASDGSETYTLGSAGTIEQSITVSCGDGAGCGGGPHIKHLYAVWIETGNLFKLHYHANAGAATVSGMPDPTTDEFRDLTNRWHEFVVTDSEPSRGDGLYFLEWNTEPGGGGVSYRAGDVFRMEFEDDGSNPLEAHLYAQWRDPNSFKLTYNANPPEGQTVTGMPDPLTQEAKSAHKSHTFSISSDIPAVSSGEYIFAGWNTKQDGKGTNHGAGGLFTSTLAEGATSSEVTLYAQWLYGNFVLIYDPNGGTGAPETASVVDPFAPSHTFDIAAAPTIENGALVFMGWADSPGAEAPAYAYLGLDHDGNADPNLASTVTLTKPVQIKTLYAVWGISYEISYSNNPDLGGTGEVPPPERFVTTARTHSFTIPEQTDANTPTRAGYVWGWWGNSPTHYRELGSHQYGEPVTFYASEPVRTLYAFYQPPKLFHLTYDKNTTEDVTNMPTESGGSSTDLIVKIKLPTSVPSRRYNSNYIFSGWSEDPNAAEGEYKPGDYYYLNMVISNRRTLYAIWQPTHRYEIYFDSNKPSDVSGYSCYIHYISGGQWVRSYGGSYSGGRKNYYSERLPVTVKSWTWDQAFWNANGVYASIPNGGSQYDYEFLGWATTRDAAVPEYTVDENGILQGSFTVSEPNTDTDCSGGDHYLYLYAVWKKTPIHRYEIYFDANRPSDVSGYSSYIHYISNGQWTRSSGGSYSGGGSYSAYRYYVTERLPVTVGSWTWDQAFWNANGVYASIPDGSGSNANYEFLGWATTRDATVPEYTVDENGIIQGSITISEPNTGTDCSGGDHYLNLYAVWKKTPIHRYEIYFDANRPSDVSGYSSYIHYISNGQWTRSSGGSYSGGGSYSAHRYYVTERLPVTVGSWTWDQAFWNANGVYASIPNGGSQYDYEFLGWATTRDATVPEYTVDENGILQGSITVSEPNTDTDCNGGDHYLYLYAVWKKTPIHRYEIYFDANRPSDVSGYSSYIHYISNGQWTRSSGGSYSGGGSYSAYRYYVTERLPVTVGSWTWDQAFWNANGVYASIPDGSGSQYDYEFLGWATTRDATVPEYTVDENGIIQGSITISEPNTGTDCSGGDHYLNLYAVWRKCRVYTLQYYNGSNLPEKQTYKMYPDDPNFDVGHTFTVSTGIPTNRSFAFVGWSTASNAVFGEYGYADNANSALHDITENLQSTITLTPSTFHTTLYAVWLYEYRFIYSANGGEGAPPTEYIYVNSGTHHFDVHPDAIPERTGFRFLGWSTDQNATEPECSPYTDDGLPMGISVTANSDGYTPVQLYAVWEQIE